MFIQNGMIQPWLEAHGLAEATQVLVYFAVARLGDAPVDGKTELDPEGLTAAWGPLAGAVAARLRAGGLGCRVLDRPAFLDAMLQKLVWICAFMLVGVRHGGCSIGEVESAHAGEVGALIRELLAAGADALGVPVAPDAEPRLMAYARSVASYPTAIKEFAWRNGWFQTLSQQAKKAGKPDPCPIHSSYLEELQLPLT